MGQQCQTSSLKLLDPFSSNFIWRFLTVGSNGPGHMIKKATIHMIKTFQNILYGHGHKYNKWRYRPFEVCSNVDHGLTLI